MAVKIRLTRIGEKKVPLYRIVVADASTPRDGRAIDTIGHYNLISMWKLQRSGSAMARSPRLWSKNFSSRRALNNCRVPDNRKDCL